MADPGGMKRYLKVYAYFIAPLFNGLPLKRIIALTEEFYQGKENKRIQFNIHVPASAA